MKIYTEIRFSDSWIRKWNERWNGAGNGDGSGEYDKNEMFMSHDDYGSNTKYDAQGDGVYYKKLKIWK